MGVRRVDRSWWRRKSVEYRAQKAREYKERLITIGMLLDANWSQSNGWFVKRDDRRMCTTYYDHNGGFIRTVNDNTSDGELRRM